MLFRKDIDPRCVYCQKGSPINDSEIACVKYGIVPVEYSCRSFQYDPLKRIPPRPLSLDTSRLRKEDFSL